MKTLKHLFITVERYFHAVDLHFAAQRLDLPAMRIARLGIARCDNLLDKLEVQP